MSDALATSVVVRAVGWALLQSLWQATLVAVATGIILAALRRGSASIRYAVGCIGLVAVAASFGATAITAIGDAPTPPAGRPGVPHRLAATPAPVDHGVLTGLLGGPVAVDARESFDPPPPSLRERFDAWSRVIVPVWLGGVLLLSVRFLVSWVMTRRVWRTPGTAVSVEWRARVDQIANRLNVTRAIRVVESAAVAVPTVIGGVRPVVLLPAAVFTGISVPQLEAILAHELAHIRRHDYLVNLLQTVLDIVFFYHPACWWISRAIRREREHCCDDAAVAYCGDRLAYAEALADLESLRDNPALLGVAATGGRLVERIRRILLPNRADRSVAAMSAVASIVLVLVLGTSGLALVSAAQSAAPGAGRQIPPDRGVIAGSVSNDAGASIGGATIDVMAADDRDRGPLGSTTLRATAGDDGRFEVEDVPPGRYLIRASAPGHLASQYGQKSASAPAAGVQVSRGRITSRVDIRLQRAGTIGGRILTNEGEGLPGVEIEVLREPGSAGTQRMPVGFAQTEAGGEFRVRNLEPGEYLVRAYASGGLRPTKNGSPRAYTSTFYPDVTTPDLAQRIHIGSGDTVTRRAIDVSHLVAASSACRPP